MAARAAMGAVHLVPVARAGCDRVAGARLGAPTAGRSGDLWRAALAMAAHQQLPFGTRIVFTFGPLGFLNGPALYYANTAILAFIFRFGVAAATYAVLLSATRRYVRLVVAVPVAYVAGFALIGLIPTDEAALGIAFALCVDRLSRPAGDSEGEWKWTALGALAGLFALEKLSIGLGIAVLCAIAVWCVPGRRRRALRSPRFRRSRCSWSAGSRRVTGSATSSRTRARPSRLRRDTRRWRTTRRPIITTR